MAVRLKDRVEANIRQSDKVNSSLSINGKSYNGSQAITVGTLGAEYGGTGETSLVNASNALLNALTTGSSVPQDADYYISQYAGGGTTTTTFHRRPVSALYSYIKNKAEGTWNITTKALSLETLNDTTSTDAFLTNNIFKVAKAIKEATTINNDGVILSIGYGGGWGAQIWLDDGSSAASMQIRNRNSATTWNAWNLVLTQSNYASILNSVYLKLAGGTMSGEIAIGQGDGKGIQLGTNGRINATSSDGTTTHTMLGVTGATAWVGASPFALTLRGSATRPTYNGNNLALQDDIVAYTSTLTTDELIDNFNYANKLSVAIWNNTSSPGVANGIIINGGWVNTTYGFQLAIDDDPTYYMALRQKTTDGWKAWKRIPMADGTGASGSWNINAATATTASFITYTHTNEINFKGGRQENCYFNYRCADDDSAETAQACTYYFDSYAGNNYSASKIYAGAIYGAVWNDYAEYRDQNELLTAGHITYCDDNGKLKYTTERLQKFEGVVSDTFGFAIGETDECKTPLAVSGRALVYCDPEDHFHSGDCVCAGPDGKAYRMTREEVTMYPDRIVGVVSEIPTYERWGTGNVEVNGRIWIKVK